MNKKERVKRALLKKAVDKIPIFISSTPQFMKNFSTYEKISEDGNQMFQACFNLDLDVIQTGHPSFYPVKVMEMPEGSKYKDHMGRTHIITGGYDNFCEPFPLQRTHKVTVEEIRENWERYEFPKPKSQKWFVNLEQILKKNARLKDPFSVWGVINGPFEPTWQLLSDGWPAFFILHRRDPGLAKDIISKVTDYCIDAGQEMVRRGVDAIRIGDDYALNEGLMTAPRVWKEIIFPSHQRLVAGLKEEGGPDFPVILHSDGNLTDILDWLAEGGIDALNPIQPDALRFEDVVDSVGSKLSMTGVFDLRYFLMEPNTQTVEMMKKEVDRLFSIVERYNQTHDKGTGFCIGPTHQIQPRSSPRLLKEWVKLIKERNSWH